MSKGLPCIEIYRYPFQIKESWYFEIVDEKGTTLLSSQESYPTKADCEVAVNAVCIAVATIMANGITRH
jgi:uncharacterized protein YegP (UPF0339 family)